MNYQSLSQLILFTILFLSACHSWKLRDNQNKTIAGYSADIVERPDDPDLYYRRARLYLQHYREEPRFGGIKECLADAEKAVALAAEKNERYQYFAQRGFCRAALAWSGFWDIVFPSGHDFPDRVGSDAENLNAGAEDFTKALSLAKSNNDRGLMLEMRALLLHLQKKHEAAALDLQAMWILYDGGKADHSLFYDHQSKPFNEATHLRDLAKMTLSTAETLAATAKLQHSGKLDSYEELRAVGHRKVAEAEKSVTEAYNDERNAKVREQAAIKAEKERRAQAERTEEERLEKIYGPRHTCSECKGSGVSKYYEMGEKAHCLVDMRSGKTRECKAAHEGAFVTKKCHVCGGKGYVFGKKGG